MGADLIGYLVLGPRQIERSTADFEAFFDQHKSRFEDAAPEDPDVIVPCDTEQWEAESHALSREAFVKGCEAFVEFWNFNNSRDCASRALPGAEDTRKVMFAGDMSWGDTPEGHGYQCFEFVEKFDLYEFFDLE